MYSLLEHQVERRAELEVGLTARDGLVQTLQSGSFRLTDPQYVQLVDHERMCSWRLILKLGESTPEITQVGKSVRVVIRGGTISVHTPVAFAQALSSRPADIVVQAAGATRMLQNIRKDSIKLVELELK